MMTNEEIRAERAKRTGRARDIADAMGISEAELVAAEVGRGVVPIHAHPDTLIPALEPLGLCMALTRNQACVIEKDGKYADFHPGDHASMTLDAGIDLRMFPKHWVHGFAIEEETKSGLRRSVQVFDAAGDAIHKAYLRESANLDAWAKLKADIALGDTPDRLTVAERTPPEGAKIVPEKRDILLKEWKRLTDTHQFVRLCAKLKMNRLGAYRLAGAPFVEPKSPGSVDALFEGLRDSGIAVMIFVGNRGCIEIHTGPLETIKPMGPWQNVLDPGFNLHLRRDLIKEVWAVEKPTKNGPVLSVETFDADGTLIFQIFGVSKPGADTRAPFAEVVAAMLEEEHA
ncbi:MAG: ChuX/HutX family heme-like substrate-binding protein [Pseudomonadota bacterium]